VDAVYLAADGDPFVCIHCGRCVPFCPHDCLEHKELGGEETAAGGAS
jgi:ferredoxin